MSELVKLSPKQVRVDGLVTPFFKHKWSSALAQRLDRMDGRTGQPQWRQDVAESAFTQRALVHLEKFVYTTLTPPLKARTFIPTDVKVNPGAEEYNWRRVTRTGIAQLITGPGQDLPRAAMYQDEIPQRLYSLGVEVVYDYFELLAIGMALENNQPIDIVAESVRAALEAIEKRLDYIAAFGTATVGNFISYEDVDVGMTGLLNNPNTSVYTLATGASGSTQWSTKTPDEILYDLNGIVGNQVATTYEVHQPDTIIVPIIQWEQQLTRRMSDVSDTTIIQFFLRSRAESGTPIKLEKWMYNSGVGAGGTDVMIAYKRDPRMLEHVLAMDASPLPTYTQGMTTTQQFVAKTAGLILRYPLSSSIAAGI